MIIVVRTISDKAPEVLRRIRKRFRSRSLEWEHSTFTLLWGLIVLGNPAVFEGPGFTAFVGGPALWGWLTFLIGVISVSALCINGYMARPTAIVRTIATVLRILLFAAISLGFLFSWRWSTALSVYPVIGFFGLFSLFWAIFDVAIPDGHDDDATAR